MRLLLVEDDPVLGDAVRAFLQAQGEVVDWVLRLAEARVAALGLSTPSCSTGTCPTVRGDWLRELRARLGQRAHAVLLPDRTRHAERSRRRP
jgi:two-component system OmpR family response regulator